MEHILDAMPDLVAILDVDCRIVRVNRALADKLGKEPAECIGALCFECIHKTPAPPEFCPHAQTLRDLQEHAAEVPEPALGGTYLVTTTPLFDRSGAFTGVLHVARDVTERKRIEQRLRESEEKFRRIVETSLEGIWSMDGDYRTTYVNRRMAQMLGYAPEEMIGRRVDSFMPEEDLTAHEEQMKKRAEGRESFYERRFLRKDKSVVSTIVSATALQDRAGRFAGSFAMFTDITERKRAEEKLRRSEEKFRLTFHTSPDAVNINRLEDGMYVSINPGFTQIMGFTEAEIIGKTSLELNVWERSEDRQRLLAGLKEAGIVRNLEAAFRAKDGRIVTGLMSASRIDLDGVPHILSITRDITDRKRAEEALRESEELHRTLVKGLPDIVMRFDREGRHLFASDNVEDLTGIPAARFIGKTHREMGFPEALCRFWEKEIREVFDRATAGETEFSFQGTQGETVFNWRLVPEFDRRGNVRSVFSISRDVTAQRKTERNYRTLFREMLEGFALHEILCDAQGVPADYRFLEVNPAFERMTGLKASDILGRTVRAILPGTEVVWIETYGRVALTGEPVFFERYHGDLQRHFRVTAFRPAPNQFACIFSDITDAKENEEKVRRSEALYRAAIEAGLDSFLLFCSDRDKSGRIRDFIFSDMNTQAERMLQKPRTRLIGKRLCEELPINRSSGFFEKYRQVAETGTPLEEEFFLPDTHVPAAWYRHTVVRVDDGIAISNRDITDRKRAEEALHRSRRDLQRILEATTEGIWSWNIRTGELYWSPQYYTMLGYEPDAFPATHENWLELIHPDDRAAAQSTLLNFITAQSDAYANEYRLRTRTGQYQWVRSRARVVERGEAGEAVLLIGNHEDITERRNLQGQLQHVQKMEAIGTLAGGIAHDFNNILAAILGYAEMAQEEPNAAKRRHNLDQVLHSAERARHLVRQILTFSRKTGEEKKPVDAGSIVQEAVKMLRSTIPTTIRIATDIRASEPLVVLMNPTQFHQVIMNLCTNAYHAMRETGGRLTIRLTALDLAPTAPLPSPDLRPGPYVKLEVADTGHGIDPQILDRIFDPFFTTKEVSQGTGLGLSVVYGIVKGGDGAVSVSSVPGAGAVFTVHLPRILPRDPDITPAPPAAPGGKERILFVDDENMLADMGTEMLKRLGYDVRGCTDAQDALRLLQQDPHAFDLVVTDMTMPDRTGMDLLREIRRLRPRMPVILCTGHSDLIDEEKALREGIRYFILKPLGFKGLAGIVRKALDETTGKDLPSPGPKEAIPPAPPPRGKTRRRE